MRSSSYTFIHLVLLTIHPSWPTGFIQPNVHSLPSLSVTSQEYELCNTYGIVTLYSNLPLKYAT